MKIGYQDLLGFLSEKPSKDLLSDKLFQLGHEHEIDHNIFDMELTPNRGDCLSLLGLARDLNIFFGKSKPVDIFEDNWTNVSFEFSDFEFVRSTTWEMYTRDWLEWNAYQDNYP